MDRQTLFSILNTAPANAIGGYWLNPIPPTDNPVITGVTSDSRKVTNGSVFVALIGSATDGHQYLEQAVAQGSCALVIDSKKVAKGVVPIHLADQVPIWVSDNTYQAFAALSSQWCGRPGQHLTMVGVTGTNGKTTVTHLIERILKDTQVPVGLIGTLGKRTASGQQEATPPNTYDSTGHTTPMAGELQQILQEMKEEGTSHVVMEVSSHALEQYRVYDCDYQVAVFTNLTQDHLDYHKTMDAYCEAKCILFQQLNPQTGPKTAVINQDDAYADRFISACHPEVTLYTYAIENPKAAIRAENLAFDITGAKFTVVTPLGSSPVHLKLGGKFSVYNALAALATGLALNIPLSQCITSLEAVPGVRGRFEVVTQNPFVIVDYAHTPDGLKNVLSAARMVTPEGGRLICVFGCGGDRDATKRPKMGRIAEELADLPVVTSDNPRSEDPQQIISDILAGIQHFNPKTMVVNPDRKQAIHQAMDLAGPQDLIVVAGKGHEDYQILADRVIHFDDAEIVREYAALKSQTTGVS